ncbi:MAG: DUF4912 domain-containing protein [Spirochaetia bacterium]|nr:DUF4912 domain-containing protein [Spirochaetia bacterium]
MTKNRLQSLSLSDLITLAQQQGIINPADMEREDLIDSIIDAFEESRLEKLEDDNWTIQSMYRKFDIFQDEEISLEKVAEIPDHFNASKVEILLVNPLMAFVFWEYGDSSRDIAQKCSRHNNLLLRVHEKNLSDNSESFFDIPIKFEENKWYINLPSNGCQYYIELICQLTTGDKVLATSNKIESPLKITRDIVSSESINRSDFLVLAGVYGFYDDEDGSGDNSQKIVSFLNTGSIREGE